MDFDIGIGVLNVQMCKIISYLLTMTADGGMLGLVVLDIDSEI